MKTTIAEPPLGQSLKAAQELFRETLFRYQLKAVTLARESGVTERQISFFKNGKGSLNCESWIQLVKALPEPTKVYYLSKIFSFEEKLMRQTFADFLREWQSRENVSQEEFELALQQRTPMTGGRLKEILGGVLPDDNELGLLGTIVRKPDQSIYLFEELQHIRDHSYRPCNENHSH